MVEAAGIEPGDVEPNTLKPKGNDVGHLVPGLSPDPGGNCRRDTATVNVIETRRFGCPNVELCDDRGVSIAQFGAQGGDGSAAAPEAVEDTHAAMRAIVDAVTG